MRIRIMDNQPVNNNTKSSDIKKYLVTEAIDTDELPKEQLDNDLAFLKKSEERAEYQPDISKEIDDPALSRAMKALRLINPFKGY